MANEIKFTGGAAAIVRDAAKAAGVVVERAESIDSPVSVTELSKARPDASLARAKTWEAAHGATASLDAATPKQGAGLAPQTA